MRGCAVGDTGKSTSDGARVGCLSPEATLLARTMIIPTCLRKINYSIHFLKHLLNCLLDKRHITTLLSLNEGASDCLKSFGIGTVCDFLDAIRITAERYRVVNYRCIYRPIGSFLHCQGWSDDAENVVTLAGPCGSFVLTDAHTHQTRQPGRWCEKVHRTSRAFTTSQAPVADDRAGTARPTAAHLSRTATGTRYPPGVHSSPPLRPGSR